MTKTSPYPSPDPHTHPGPDVADRVIGVIRDTVEPDVPVALDSKLVADLGADSLALVEVVLALEDEFEIDLADEVVERWQDATVADVVVVVSGLLGSQRAAS